MPLVTGVLRELAGIPAPGVPMRSTGDDWGSDDPGLAGEMLVHTDPHGGNFMVHGGRAWLLDWGWAMRGPAWVTSARLVPHLIEAGWSAADAERLLADVPAWAGAPAGTVSAYVADLAGSFERAFLRRPGNEHRRRWHEITRAWADYRAGLGAGRV